MFAKTCAIAFIAICLFNASLAAPAPEPEPEAQPDPCGCGCGRGSSRVVSKIHTVPISSNVPIKTTHTLLSNEGGYGGLIGGYGSSIGYGGIIDGWDSGYSGWGNIWDGGCGERVITRIHHIPVTTHIPIKTTHRVIPQSDCGLSGGLSTLGGYGNGCGYGCGCSGWL